MYICTVINLQGPVLNIYINIGMLKDVCTVINLQGPVLNTYKYWDVEGCMYCDKLDKDQFLKYKYWDVERCVYCDKLR